MSIINSAVKLKQYTRNLRSTSFSKTSRNPNLTTSIIVAAVIILSFILAAFGIIDLKEVIRDFQSGIIVIYIALDFLTTLIVRTKIMEVISVRLAELSKGRHGTVLVVFSSFVFVVSAFLNNITATLVVLPIIFVLLKSMDLNKPFVASLFSLFLASCNLGGASTPIGDFPAIVIMKSGLTDFSNYLSRAFPLFTVTAFFITAIHLLLLLRNRKRESTSQSIERELAVKFLNVRYRHVKVRTVSLILIGIVFSLMFTFWILLPANQFPPELIALAGLFIAIILTGHNKNDNNTQIFDLRFDLNPVMALGAFLLFSADINNSGLLQIITNFIQQNFHNPVTMLISLMVSISILTGIISAGPAAAATMPLLLSLSVGPLQGHQHILAIAFAASVCAGSSLFMWSATSGILLSKKVKDAELRDKDGQFLDWGVRTYFKYGLIHFMVQLGIGILWVLVNIKTL